MIKSYLLTLVMLVACSFGIAAQVVTTEPSPLQEDSENVVIYFHADQGTKGLMGQPATAALYAHTGVCIVDANGKESEWQYAPTWGNNNAKYKLEYVSPNLWKLVIGDMRTYYGVKATETIKRLAFVFRNSNGSAEGKGEGGTDIYVDVVDSGFQLALTSSASSSIVNAGTGAVTFTAATTQNAKIEIKVNDNIIASQNSVKSISGEYTFSAAGDYNVVATATNASGETLTKTLSYCNPPASVEAGFSTVPPMGAFRNDADQVTFCIAAPQKSTAILVGSWNDYKITSEQVMKFVDGPADGQGSFRYFTLTLNDIPKNEPVIYYYIIDGISVGDPYARLVLDPWNDKYIGSDIYPLLPEYPLEKVNGVPLAVFQDNLGAYDWKVKDFKGASKDNLIIYELLFRDFTGTEGKADGNGTVRKAIAKIPYLKSLGINAVELLPINEFNGNISWGYNPNFYFAIDKAYGTPEDYKEFIDICHQNGIAVILDVVFNQSDGLHPWYVLYPNNGQNPFYNQNAPHAYSVLNDWNQGYPLVQQQWHDMLKYWLSEYKVDGFRFDLVKGLGDNDSYANNGDAATNNYNASRVARMKRLHEAVKEVNPDAYFINENLAGAKEENEMAADGELNWANVNEAGCEFAMGYSTNSNSNLQRMWAVKDGRTAGSTVSYLESHDEERLAFKQDKYGASGVKGNKTVSCQRLAAAAAQMILVPGSHMIWQFSEMGNAQTTKNSNGGNNTDPKIVNWALMDDPANAALVQSYRELIHIRLANQDLFSEDADYNLSFSGGNIRYASTFVGDKELHLFINAGVSGAKNLTANFRSTDGSKYQVLSQTDGITPQIEWSSKKVTIPANSYVVVASNNVTSDVEDIFDDALSMTVYEEGGVLNVANASGLVEVWNAAGMKVASGDGEISVALPAGIYIVRNGAKTVKTLVR